VSGDESESRGTGAPQDGRLTRAARTRASVVDALLTLNEQGELRPTARDIAKQAGVSLRSLYVHFDDLEALFVAASHRHAERLGQVLPPLMTEGSLDERLDAFLDRRVRIHEFGAGVRRAALLQEPFSPVLKKALANGRQALRSEITSCFAPEIAAATASAPAAAPAAESPPDRLLLALEIATSSAAWESLRTHQNLSVGEATAQLRDMVLVFLNSWVPGSPGAEPSATTRTSAAGPPGRPTAQDHRRHVR
jgi:AcrR family transcriptional regulator